MPTTKQLNAATLVVATVNLIPVRGHTQVPAVTPGNGCMSAYNSWQKNRVRFYLI